MGEPSVTWHHEDSSVAIQARCVDADMAAVRRELLGGTHRGPWTGTVRVLPCDDVAELNAAYEWLATLIADASEIRDLVRERLLLFHAEEVESLSS